MPDLLIELFSEEIPARMQDRAGEDLKTLVTGGLVEAGITYESAAAFTTPRRLALSITGLPAQSPAVREERRGPRADAPERAIEGFLRATGLERDALETRDDKKGPVLFAVIRRPGRAAADVVAQVLAETLRAFPWPKSMRWGTGGLRWVRPLHSILCVLSGPEGAETVPIDLDGIPCGDVTEGHRFMGSGPFSVTSFEDYEAKLRQDFVMLDASERRDHILSQTRNLAFARGLDLVEDKALLAELAGLVEWPVVLVGNIAGDFLDLPPEVLRTSMKTHQKFFSLRNPKTGRIEQFVTVANRETADRGALILAGNEKVLFARLSDAKFFWENDLRVPLEKMAARLGGVTFHNRLGSQADRIDRIAGLSRRIAPLVGADPRLAEQAARVVKADLASEMVQEFPELQGVMGKYYAHAAGLPDEIAAACEDHYAPLGPGDAVPTKPVSVAVALADKIDMLTGFWAIDEKPTGSRDPFALRRAALGVIRIVLENDVRAGLAAVFAQGYAGHDGGDLVAFFHDRLKVHLRARGIRHDVIDACLALGRPAGGPDKGTALADDPATGGNDDLVLVVNRARALAAFLETEDGENLLQGFKRANNILRQAEEKDGVAYEGAPDVKFADDASETALFSALDGADAAIRASLADEDFAAAMRDMAALRAPIDAFFEAVQINTENAIMRRNRLCLLNRIREVMGRVAAFERIEG